MQLGRFPRTRLAHGPTPLEPMERLGRELGGPRLWVKRDDCTGLGLGGNKTRKLEFLAAEALAQGADTLVTVGAVQSNHVRQTAAAAAQLGLACEAVLERRMRSPADVYARGGNVLLDRMFGATLHFVDAGTDPAAACDEVAAAIRRRGGRPCVIPTGGSTPVGALGYVQCAQEILTQATDLGFAVDAVVHASGSAGTQAGLVAGFEGLRSGVDVLGISVSRPRAALEPLVHALAERTAELLGVAGGIDSARVAVDSGYVGPGYGVPTQSMIDAVGLAATREGLLLDPVYSGKAMAGLIDLARNGKWPARANVVFVHTGGAPALFAYQSLFDGS